jgi:hypothetical protein
LVAYYFRYESPPAERRDSIDVETLKDANRHTGCGLVTDPRVTLNNATAVGYLNRNGGGTYTISTVGENLVAMTLPGNGDGGARAAKKRRSGGKTSRAKK